MAKILFGGTIGDARGSIGAATYTKNRFGAAIRQKVSPVQPRTARVLTVRGLFTNLSKRWFGTLDDAQRLGWIALADANPRTNVFGNSVKLTGLQMYQSLNRNLQNVGEAIIDDPPPNLDVDGLTSITPAPDATGGTFMFDAVPDPVPAGHWMVIDATLQVNAGRSFVSNYYRYVSQYPSGPPLPYDMHAAYVAIFGALRLGQRITCRAFTVKIATGARSVPVVATALVV
jgi:hypothetical protein